MPPPRAAVPAPVASSKPVPPPRAVPAPVASSQPIRPKAEAPKPQQIQQQQQPEQQTADGQPAVKLSIRQQARAKARARAAAEAEAEATAAAAEPQQTADPAAVDPSEIAGAPPNEEGEEQEEDTDGTKKMKKEFDLMMRGLETEMEAGSSKLAKVRERIRKAKASIKDADDALAADDKAREDEKKAKN